MDWDPDSYLKFRNERRQPSVDLVTRISKDFYPRKIIDIGCGPGNSSEVLAERWPTASVVGIDTSEDMIKKARKDYPNQEWIIADASTYNPNEKFDLVFSNATIQWIPDHTKLLGKFHAFLSDNGILAIQIPLFWDMYAGKAIREICGDNRWKSQTDKIPDLFTIHDYPFYYDLLSHLFKASELWETFYMHILESHLSILEMIRSTGLKPFLDILDNVQDKCVFETEVLKKIKRDYPVQANGKVIFPFKRLFFIGYK
jgi:trans-aconitate 2-methyltransferase